MPRYNQKLKFSINPSIINKTHPDNKKLLSEGFEAVEGTVEELAEAVQEEGWAFSYVFENGKRAKSQFISADLIAVDIDGGFKIGEMLEQPIVKDYCSFIYTTPSHTVEHHRYRLVFVLPRTITNSEELSAASRALSRRLGGDMAATDPARLFFGSKGCKTWLFDREIDEDFLDELIEDGKRKAQKDSILNNHITTTRSAFTPKENKTVLLTDKSEIQLKDIQKTTTIFCPFHHDDSPSAFVSVSHKGSKFIRCSSCQMTWWVDDRKSDYDFNSFISSLKEIKEKVSNETVDGNGPLSLMYTQTIKQPNIHFMNSEFFELQQVREGITFIRSPKGSGKTTFLSESIKSVIQPLAKLTLAEYEEMFDEDVPFYSDERVILVGHRQALIGDLSKKLGLNCYLEDGNKSGGEIKERQKRYAVCVDSLKKVEKQNYQIVVIDEVEQVLAHFMSETIGDKRRDLFTILSDKIKKADKVIVLDADIGWVSFITLSLLAPEKEVFVYVNEYKQDERALNLYQNESNIVGDLIADISHRKRVFVTSNSKEKIKTLEKAVQKHNRDNKLNLNILSITSENSRQADIQDFIKNISSRITEYDVILSSPSLGTGIDITFENRKQEIDAVYGMFENLINSHFEIDQQLARVRHPGAVNVWVSPRTFNFETDLDVVTQDYLEDHFFEREKLKDNFDDLPPFIRMIGMITAEQRASKNNLKQNFIDYKLSQGWTINLVEKDFDLVEIGKQLFKDGKRLKELEYTNLLMNAETMNRYDYYRFKQAIERNDEQLEQGSWYAYYRTNLELFYRKPVSDELIQHDSKGKLSRQIRQYERLINMPNFFKSQVVIEQGNESRYLKNPHQANILLYGLLTLTPIFNDGQFDLDIVFTKDDLSKFTKAVIKMKKQSELHLEITTKSDVVKKSVEHLSTLLKLIGLKLFQPQRPTTKNGVKTYYYSICPYSFEIVTDIVDRRKRIDGWQFIDDLFDFKYSAIEEDWLDNHFNSIH